MTDDQVAQSQALVVEVFHDIRAELLSVFGNIPFTRKGNRSPVTEWDVKVETKLREELSVRFPELGFEGEETGASGSREAYWLVDPIDGTSSFIRGLYYSTNMAALVVKGEVVAAVIYDFVHDYTYTAIKGKGAFKDGQPISVNKKRPADDLVLYSFTRGKFHLVREALHELRMRVLLTMGAAGHSFVMLAEGKIDGLICLGTSMGLYDIAPGLLIAEEAGAEVLAYDDKSGVDRHEFIVGSPLTVELIEKSGLL